jgi:plastocyanin
MKRMKSAMIMGLMVPVLWTACSDTSEIRRTGIVKNIVIGDEITPERLTVRAGDQVQWLNQRMDDVRVEFDKTVSEQISCNTGFRVMAGIGHDTARLARGQSASLCFTNVGPRRYVVRTDSSALSGEENLTGTVTVE